MKMLVIPDVHLKPWMFEDADRIMQTEIADNVICLGDIPDDFKCKNNAELYNKTFDKAEEFLEKHPESLWVIGNHEASYLWNKWQSGKAYHAEKTAEIRINRLYKKIREINSYSLAYVFHIGKVIFSHAGITESFIKMLIQKYPYITKDINGIDEMTKFFNSLYQNDLWNDYSFLWARPQGLISKYEQMWRTPDADIQVAGHTPMKEITIEGKTDDIKSGILISCDVFSTDRDRKPYGNEEYLLIDTVTGEWQGIKPPKSMTHD